MKIGVLGGTFDPPHLGHLILASEALEQGSLDQILWVLTPNPPHKLQDNITHSEYRERMVELAINNNDRFSLSCIDLDRDPPHFAVDTMTILRKKSPMNEYHYVMGLDSLNDLPEWHQPVDFVAACDSIIVMLRSGESLNTNKIMVKIPGLEHKVKFLTTPLIDISATDIRSRIKSGRSYRYFLTDNVYRYILENQIYSP